MIRSEVQPKTLGEKPLLHAVIDKEVLIMVLALAGMEIDWRVIAREILAKASLLILRSSAVDAVLATRSFLQIRKPRPLEENRTGYGHSIPILITWKGL
jgi:hypothetical protein